jgi:electron transfer flavoprotein alpha subunit
MYAGNAVATVKMSDPTKFLLVRSTVFDKAPAEEGSAGVESSDLDGSSAGHSVFVSESKSESARPDLTAARVVISGGRGLKNGENFAMLEEMADKLGGAVGASRAAVDAGFVPNDYQVHPLIRLSPYMCVGLPCQPTCL